ncbi:MAG: NAD(P)H-hydrate dehydratase [Spirochaetia bacterium]|nr:NAD(P)H-hydrate dehydratase [Spirochaetia bacterium]
MKRLVSCAESRELDESSRTLFGIDSLLLMEKASLRMWDCLLRRIERSPKLGRKGRDLRILALCGKGDNGGDALAMLRHARSAGFGKLAAIVSSLSLNSSVALQMGFNRKAGIPCLRWAEIAEAERLRLYAEADLVLDGIVGSGVQGAARGEALEMIELTKSQRSSRSSGGPETGTAQPAQPRSETVDGPLLVSVDIPSGLGDTWTEAFPAVWADMSLCLDPIKKICLAPAARNHCGEILGVGDVFPGDLIEGAGATSLLEEQDLKGLMDRLAPDSYKMSRGRLGIFAGSLGSAGAALLCAKAASAAGAGYIYLFVDEALYPVVAGAAESFIVRSWSSQTELPYCDAVLAGPGWGTGEDRIQALRSLGADEERPLILDADAIRLLAKLPGLRDALACPVALTPHPGEYSDLANSLGTGVDDSYPRSIAGLAEGLNALMLAKSHTSWIMGKKACYVWEGLTPELGVAGSGDVLAGLFAGLLARKIAGLKKSRKRESLSEQTIEGAWVVGAWAAVIAQGCDGRRLARRSGWFEASQLIEACAQVLHENETGEGKNS